MNSGWHGLNRAFAPLRASLRVPARTVQGVLLGAISGLCACVAQPSPYGYGGAAPPPRSAAVQPASTGHRIAVLLPLTGSGADLGRSMLRAAKLAFDEGSPAAYDEKDTNGTPAAAAAEAAIAGGADIIVGPLTAGETEAVTPVAKSRGVPVLAFTSDTSKAQPGVWALGLTPEQQARALIRAMRADNKSRIGAVLPRNAFGDALAAGLVQAAQEEALPPPRIARYQAGAAGLESAISEIAGGEAQVDLAAPPPIDGLMFGTTAEATIAALPALAKAGLGQGRVRLLGTAIWARNAAQLSSLAGAWFSGPSPQTLRVFVQTYMTRYGTPPRDLASIAFDAAGAAKAATGPNGVNINTLLTPSGFAGANGVFVLLPDGRVRRSLAVFEIRTGGAEPRELSPAS